MTDPDQRLQRVIAALVRQEFGAPITTIIGLTEIMIEDARRSGDNSLASDLSRIHSAGLLLQGQLGSLVTFATRTAFNSGADLAEFKTKLRHDLRTPLNAVKGYSELIIEEARDTGREELLADVAKVLSAAEQLLGQIDKVLGLTDASEASAPNAPSFAGMPSPDQVGQIMRSNSVSHAKAAREPLFEPHPCGRRHRSQSRTAVAQAKAQRSRRSYGLRRQISARGREKDRIRPNPA